MKKHEFLILPSTFEPGEESAFEVQLEPVDAQAPVSAMYLAFLD
jgi:hypothetical protein